MKRIIALLFALIFVITMFAGCKAKEETQEQINAKVMKSANKALSEYKKAMSVDKLADDTIIQVIYKDTQYFCEVKDGKIDDVNEEYSMHIRSYHSEIDNTTIESIPDGVTLYLPEGSKLPEGTESKMAREDAEEMLRLYQMPVSDGAEPRVMEDNAVFEVAKNGKKYYFVCLNDAIDHEDPEMEKVIEEGKEYTLDSADWFTQEIYLYLPKKAKKSK